MKIVSTQDAIDRINEIIRALNKEYHQENRFSSADLADQLDDIRQFLGRDL